MKKIVVLLLLTGLLASGALTFEGGSGTEADPYQISTCTQLQNMTDNLNSHFELVSDVDCSGTETWNSGNGFNPIDDRTTNNRGFNGSLDGQDYTISDLFIDRDSEDDVGLIGQTQGESHIEIVNLTLENINISGSSTVGGLTAQGMKLQDVHVEGIVNGSSSVGGIVGYMYSGKVERSSSKGEVTGESGIIGGLAGRVGNDEEVVLSFSSADVSGESGSATVGGLVGTAGYIYSSYSNGSVSISSSSAQAGGLVGGGSGDAGPFVYRSFSVGAVSGSGTLGGLAPSANGLNEYNYWDNESSGQSTSAIGTPLTTSQMQGSNAEDNMQGLDFVNNWSLVDSDYPRLQWEDYSNTLQPQRPSAKFTVSNLYKDEVTSFDASSSVDPNGDSLTYDWEFGQGSVKNDTGATTSFDYQYPMSVPVTLRVTDTDGNTGIKEDQIFIDVTNCSELAYDGGDGSQSNPYQISNLDQLYCIGNGAGGLSENYELVNDIDAGNTSKWFPYTDEEVFGGRDTPLYEGFDPIGDYSDEFNGSFDGNQNVVSGLYINRGDQGLFTETTINSYIHDLGLEDVELRGGDSGALSHLNYGTVERVYSTGVIYGGSSYDVGGLIGDNNGEIKKSYSSVDIEGEPGDAGGLVGDNGGNISNSFATGSVSGSSDVGGLVGYHYDYGSEAIIEKSYSVGEVTGNSDVGGIVGDNSDTVTDSYWDTQTSGQSSSAGGTGLTTSEMQDSSASSNMNFDFNNIWTTTVGYPKLQWMDTGDGSSSNPIKIHTCHDLQAIKNNLSASYILKSNIDCSDTSSYNGGTGFNPIGTTFSGTLDGDGFFIKGLKIDASRNPALIEETNGNAEIKNIGLRETEIQDSSEAAALVAYNAGASISKIFAQGSVDGNQYAGGLVGNDSAGSISHGASIVDVNGSQKVGGLAGFTSNSQVTNAYSAGNVTGSSSLGGLIGDTSGGTVTDGYWDNESSGQSNSAGGTDLEKWSMQGSNASGNMTGLDFSNVWNEVEESDSDALQSTYPILRDLHRVEQLKALGVYTGLHSPSPYDGETGLPVDTSLSIGIQGFEFRNNITFYDADQASSTTVNYDFEDSFTWSVSGSGVAGRSTDCAISGTYSAYTGENQVSITSPTIDTSDTDTGVDISYKVRRGDDGCSEDPDGTEDLETQYYTESGSWQTIKTHDVDNYNTGEIKSHSHSLSDAAIHPDFQLRFEQLSGTGTDYDYWHMDDVNIQFENKGVEIGKDELVYDGNRGSITWSGRSECTTYNWFVEASHGSRMIKSEELTFKTTCNDAPSSPTLVNPSDGGTGVPTNPNLEVSVSDPNGDNLDVTFYDSNDNEIGSVSNVPSGDTASVTWNDLAENTNYEWYVEVSDGQETVSNSANPWNFTTVNVPDLKLVSPDNQSTVSPDTDLKAEVRQQDGKEMNIFFELRNRSDGSFVDSASFTNTSSSWTNFTADIGLQPGSEYEWDVNVTLTDISYEVYNFSGISDFSTVETPEVVSIEPANESQTNDNPTLNVTVQGNAPINVTLNDYEKVSNPEFYSEQVNPGETVSFDLNNYGDMGEDTTERWWVGLNSSGALWNNSDDPYEFSTSEVSEVNYQVQNFDSGDNLNPGIYGGLDDVVGQKEIIFEVSNPEGKDMDIEFNVSNSTASEKFGQVNGVSSGDTVTVDITEASMVEENKAVYELNAFYREGQSIYDQDSFTSNNLDFSTYVTELSWTDESPQRTDEFRIYYNESDVGFNLFSEVGVTDVGNTNVGVANENLSSDNSVDCYAVRAWSAAGGLSDFAEPAVSGNPGSNCLGDTQP